MPMTRIDYRDRAREAVARARKQLDAPGEAAVRYACLELRFAVEFLTYSLLQVYLAEVPDDTLRKWTPREVIGELLNADERADQSVRMYVGIERVPGVPAESMQDMGEERRLGRQEIVRFHNAMGNFLHAPTLDQLDAGDIPPDKIRGKADEVLRALEEVLSSRVFNLNFGNFVTFLCSECQSSIKRKVEGIDPQAGVVCRRRSCGAIFDMREVDGKPVFSLRQNSGQCPKCEGEWKIPVHRIKAGAIINCQCGVRFELVLGIREMAAPAGQQPG